MEIRKKFWKNTSGSFTCSCNSGYTGDGRACTNYDECATGNHNCASVGATCTDTVGSYTCACNTPAFTGEFCPSVFKFAKTDIKATDIHVPMSMSAKAHIHVLEHLKFVSTISEVTRVAVQLVIQCSVVLVSTSTSALLQLIIIATPTPLVPTP